MKKALFILPLILLSMGCSRIVVGINGFTPAGTTLQPDQYSPIVVIEDPNATNPILEKEIAGKIQKLLNSKGYTTSTFDKANYYLLFQYSIDSGQTTTGAMPLYNTGGTATINTFNSNGGYSYSALQMPGYTSYVPYSLTTYTRWLVLRLIDGKKFQETKKIEHVWIGEITSSGSSSDLRRVINYLLVGAFEHFGENTKKRIKKTLFEGDERVKLLMEN